jgi:hypothetical protein
MMFSDFIAHWIALVAILLVAIVYFARWPR